MYIRKLGDSVEFIICGFKSTYMTCCIIRERESMMMCHMQSDCCLHSIDCRHSWLILYWHRGAEVGRPFETISAERLAYNIFGRSPIALRECPTYFSFAGRWMFIIVGHIKSIWNASPIISCNKSKRKYWTLSLYTGHPERMIFALI
jgi:hypothetical protein